VTTGASTAGMTRKGTILFAPGVVDPAPDSVDAIKNLALPLNSALATGAGRVELMAYAGARGDKSSDARRLSLRRAVIIRQLLIDGGVPAERIDVHAMGGTTDSNSGDRVDVFTRA
jgi:outer membrane protein OmpA-like peptidoglycan-associated protein